MSREHVFPDWLNSVFGTAAHAPFAVSWTHGHAGQPDTRRAYGSRTIDQTVKTVCVVCNTGWMSRLEAQAKTALTALIRDESLALTAQDQVTLAAWAAMKAVVAEDLGGRPVASDVQRDAIRLGAGPPGASRVLAGRYTGTLGPLLYERILGQAPSDHPLAGAMAGASVTVMGAIAIFVYLAPSDIWNSAVMLGQRRPSWTTFWPPVMETNMWPPAESLDERGVLRLLGETMPGSEADLDYLESAWPSAG